MCLFICFHIFFSGFEHNDFSYPLDVIASKIAQNWQHCIEITILFEEQDLVSHLNASMYP